MSLFQHFTFGREHNKEALLAEQVAALQARVAKCREAALRWRRLRATATGAIAALMLASGFVLGVYRDHLEQRVAHLVFPAAQAAPESGYAAYRRGDYQTAWHILRPLAENGDARAQFNVGVMYSEGQGVPQDHAEAGKWYRLSAGQGYAQAQYNLGLWYARAEGTSQDDVRAHMWFNLAATRFPHSDILSRSAAIKNRDTVASRMTDDQIVQAQRLAREWQPSS
jgi:uncharacterized protein